SNHDPRLTALELKALQIPSVMICDTMVGSLFQHHDIHAVGESSLHQPSFSVVNQRSTSIVVGADRIAKNGDTANKASSIPRVLQIIDIPRLTLDNRLELTTPQLSQHDITSRSSLSPPSPL